MRLWSRGVDHALFRPRGEQALDLPRPIFLYVGRVAVEKNLEALLGLDLPGSTVDRRRRPGAGRASSAAIRTPISSATGTARRWREFTRAPTCSSFPSRTDTFGIVLIEAMASGLPVAAFPVPGPIDVVGPDAGVLDEDLRAACLKALTIPREAAREYSMRFTWKESARQFLDNVEASRRRLLRAAPKRLELVGDA